MKKSKLCIEIDTISETLLVSALQILVIFRRLWQRGSCFQAHDYFVLFIHLVDHMAVRAFDCAHVIALRQGSSKYRHAHNCGLLILEDIIRCHECYEIILIRVLVNILFL